MEFKNQFRLSYFGFANSSADEFFTPLHNCCHKDTLLIIRGVFALYTVVFMLTDIIRTTIKKKSCYWFSFFTSWSYVITTAYFITSFVQTMRFQLNAEPKARQQNSNLTLILQKFNDGGYTAQSLNYHIVWILYEIAIVASPLTAIIYWVLYDSKNEECKCSSNVDWFFMIDRHGIGFILLLIEFFFQRNTYRVLHLYLPTLVWTVYSIFNYCYWKRTGVNVYTRVDWSEHPIRAILESASVVFVGTVYYMLFFFVDLLKRKYILTR